MLDVIRTYLSMKPPTWRPSYRAKWHRILWSVQMDQSANEPCKESQNVVERRVIRLDIDNIFTLEWKLRLDRTRHSGDADPFTGGEISEHTTIPQKDADEVHIPMIGSRANLCAQRFWNQYLGHID
jgi:hypothetical protein